MKGIVFTEFIDMIEQVHGDEFADRMLTESELESGGIYTAVGTYPFSEMVTMLTWLKSETGATMGELQSTFGKFIFGTFLTNYQSFFDRAETAFDFLESIEKHIHVEVRKLYPDAELPTFETKLLSDSVLEMIYKSERKMSSFAEGLIEKTLVYYQTDADIETEMIKEDGSEVRFVISKK